MLKLRSSRGSIIYVQIAVMVHLCLILPIRKSQCLFPSPNVYFQVPVFIFNVALS